MNDLSPLLMQHFRAPRLVGRAADATGAGSAENHGCGDLVQFSVRVANGRVEEARFLCQGCSASIGAASYLAERATGCSAEAIADWSVDAVLAEIGGCAPTRRHGIALALRALQRAVFASRAGTPPGDHVA